MKFFLACSIQVLFFCSFAQKHKAPLAEKWVDSVFKTLNDEQKIAQLIVVRLSSIEPVTRKVVFYDKEVADAINKYDIGGVCLFQGGPVTQANFVNHFQAIAKTPIMICIDAENGVGVRMDSVMGLPRQMMLGAMQDPALVYEYGKLVGEQCKRLGITVNYAPVVDINNNPDNPVINDRSFGEDKNIVAMYGMEYMKGLQAMGVMACAKHFPGHGDVSVDSHLDLPVIHKSVQQLDTLELYPFKKLFEAGVGSVMIAHLSIPDIDNTPNLASSLSKKMVTGLLRKKLKYQGLSFTDALEMKGVAKYFPVGESAVQSLIAGNDMLCLPGNVDTVISTIKEAIADRKIKWKDINVHVKRVLLAKYNYGLSKWQPVNTDSLTEDLNKNSRDMRKKVAEEAITLLRNDDPSILPLHPSSKKKIAYVGIGINNDNEFANRMRSDFDANVYYFDYSLDSIKAAALAELLKNRYETVVIGLHNYHRFPANNFGISNAALWLIKKLQQENKTMSMVFGNPYIIKNLCDAKNLLVCYEDDEITQDVAADWLNMKFTAKGKLPVTVCDNFKFGYGITAKPGLLPIATAASVGLDPKKLEAIDSICNTAIRKEAFPGCVVLVAKDGKVVYDKAFGYLTYEKKDPVYAGTIYDLASVTKICATTMAVMKLYEEGKLDLQKTLGDYLPWVRGTNKAPIKIWDVLLHQAGLKAFIPFYKETISQDKAGIPLLSIYSWKPDSLHSVRVAEKLYMRSDWIDTIYSRILQSEVGSGRKYVYSDNDFIFMGKIVQAISGMPLNEYVKKNFYEPLGMSTTGFLPRTVFPLSRIAPTENEQVFRRQLLRGDVHDPGAAMFGGVSGHAGLFSDAYDLAVMEQMLLNGGSINGQRFLKKETIDYFTDYHSDVSRRGIGFDKPEKDREKSKDPYPCASASPLTFGHTGFTGTCVWVDPKYNLVFIFLSNRVNPSSENGKISSLSVRGSIMETIYKSMNEGH